MIGVEAVDADAMTQSLAAGHSARLDQVGLFADGAAVKQVGSECFRIAETYVDEMIRVDNDAICAAIKDVFEDTRSVRSRQEAGRGGYESLGGAKQCAG